MEFQLYSYLSEHPIQKRVAKYWIKANLPVPSFIKRQLANEIHTEMIIRLMGVVVNDGSLTLKKALEVHFELGQEISEQVKDILSVNPNDIESLSSIIDFLHDLLFISGKQVVKSTDNEAVSQWSQCPLSSQLASSSSNAGEYYCHLYQEMYKGVLFGINPKARANDLNVTQSQGCEYCELRTWFEERT